MINFGWRADENENEIDPVTEASLDYTYHLDSATAHPSLRRGGERTFRTSSRIEHRILLHGGDVSMRENDATSGLGQVRERMFCDGNR